MLYAHATIALTLAGQVSRLRKIPAIQIHQLSRLQYWRKMTDPEKRLIRDINSGKEVSLERGLLILSGLKTEEAIELYTKKLDQIHEGFVEKLVKQHPVSLATLREYMMVSLAKLLFVYLWNKKPRRCNTSFLLTDVIDAQLNPDVNQTVGSCVGLTSLYTVLGLREELDLTILVSDSHMLNRLRTDGTLCNIDNTDPLGFDLEMETDSFSEYPVLALLTNVLNSRGLMKEGVEDWQGALLDYSKALKINSEYANAYNNRGNIKLKLADYPGAIIDYDQAIALNHRFVEAYSNRGIARQYLGDDAGAGEDFDQAIELNATYVDAYFRRGVVRQNLGDYAGATEDFDKVVELDPESGDKILRFRERFH
jgi:tetratricopeptide (TPR) repeat protein